MQISKFLQLFQEHALICWKFQKLRKIFSKQVEYIHSGVLAHQLNNFSVEQRPISYVTANYKQEAIKEV